VTTVSNKIQTWAVRMRYTSYVCGVFGMVFMLAARSMAEPERSVWATRAMIFLGLMFCGFVTYYMLSLLRMYRR